MLITIILITSVFFILLLSLSKRSKVNKKKPPELSWKEWRREFAKAKSHEEEYEYCDHDEYIEKAGDFFTIGGELFHRASGKEIPRPEYRAYNFDNEIANRKKLKIAERFNVSGFFAVPEEAKILTDWASSKNSDPIKLSVRLIRDPNNIHDKNAIKINVFGDGLSEIFVGYLPKDISAKYVDDLPVITVDRLFEGQELSGKVLVPRKPKVKD